ncbi:MAG: hypothetical protein WCK29_01185 [archaeon]
MVKKQKQKKKKLIVDNDLLSSLENSGFSGKVKNRAYMAPIQREILEYKKLRKKRKKAKARRTGKNKKEAIIRTAPQLEKTETKKEGIFSKLGTLFKPNPRQLVIPKLTVKPTVQAQEPIKPVEPVQPTKPIEYIQQPLSSAEVIKQIKYQEIKTKTPVKENLFPDLKNLDHHKDEIEILEHEPIQEKTETKKEGIFSKIKSIIKYKPKKKDDSYTLEPITASNDNNQLKDASINQDQKKDNSEEETKENDSESSSIDILYSEKKKKII